MALHAELAFFHAHDVLAPDDDGVRRARSFDPDALHADDVFDMQACAIEDCSDPSVPEPWLTREGFGSIDLTGTPGLLPVLEDIRTKGVISEGQARTVRQSLRGTSFPLAGGWRLRFLYIAPEGMIVRRGGPNGLRVTATATARGMNEHDAAVSVHADQDVLGTPVKQILRGTAPWLFRHDSPHGRNRRSPLCLLNLWVPLQQPTRPLVLMDTRTLDRQRHQLRYALPTDRFLDRPPDRAVNDIWAFLHDGDQRWVCRSDAGPHSAWVFDTFSTPHGAVSLPGEELAEALYLSVHEAVSAIEQEDVDGFGEGLRRTLPDVEAPTLPLRRAVGALKQCRHMGRELGASPTSGDVQAWLEQARTALDGVVRKSLEMRTVALLTPDWFSPSISG